jgi:hypothetical protein
LSGTAAVDRTGNGACIFSDCRSGAFAMTGEDLFCGTLNIAKPAMARIAIIIVPITVGLTFFSEAVFYPHCHVFPD